MVILTAILLRVSLCFYKPPVCRSYLTTSLWKQYGVLEFDIEAFDDFFFPTDFLFQFSR